MQQSELALFSQGFRRALGPLGAALDRAVERLRATERRAELAFPADELEGGLGALAGELSALLERIVRERATVFVFGPAKAGKSTLLDALAGARVSEVSILPSYPCLLRARHAPQESAALLRFDGSAETLPDPAALRLVLQRAHGELAVRAREVRASGEAFDPARHHLSAVRRVERAQPAAPLERRALELVECPPIHAPHFGSYGEMLIGEPDQARAAVFVLRAAQLCDDAVFDGIEELLASFERLILVINLDERARELSRAGELAPSAEREDPSRLIAAFEELSLCEPLTRAVRAGRVPVLALDLLEAARARLHGVDEPPPASARSRTRFSDLLRELGGVLDGHEAFRALAHSALRRGIELGDEARELAGTPGLADLARRRDQAARERTSLEGVRTSLERLAARAAARARELAHELEAPLARAIEDWFAGGASLKELLDSALEPRLAAARAELARAVERGLRDELKRAPENAALSASAQADLEQARVTLAALFAPCVERLHVTIEPVALRALDVESIPVHPRLGQRLTLRAAAEVRRALFGPPEAPARALASADKARRLGDEARQAMQRSAAERARSILEEEGRLLARALDEALLSTFLSTLQGHAERERARLDAPLRELEARAGELGALDEALSALAPACARARAELAELAERFEPAAVLLPAPRPALEPSAGSGARRNELAYE